jgi:hypothetical protein
MPKTDSLVGTLRRSYDLIMDPDKNPLSIFPAVQKFQMMIYLSVMWTTIFCAAFGGWYWYGELITGHVLVVFGVVMTSIVFSRATRQARSLNR